ITDQLTESGTKAPARRILLQSMAQAELKTIPPSWIEAVAELLGKRDTALVTEAVAAIRAWRLPADRANKLGPDLRAAGEDPRLPTDVRLLSLAAIPGGMPEISAPLFEFLGGLLNVEQSPKLRSLAAEILSAARLKSNQQRALAALLRTTGPME